MDVAFILDQYFKGKENVSIDVFDAQTLNAVYRDVVTAMTSHFDIEVSVLQALSYCLYEMMDNVHIHSGKPFCLCYCPGLLSDAEADVGAVVEGVVVGVESLGGLEGRADVQRVVFALLAKATLTFF